MTMLSTHPALRRRTALAAIGLSSLTCAACATQSPPQQGERELKAAGVPVFEILCSKDLWSQTSYNVSAISVTEVGDGLAEIKLSGPDMVDYLETLDSNAHGGMGEHDPDSIVMYNAVAPVIDRIRPGTSTVVTPPQIVVDAATPAPEATAVEATPTARP